MWIADKWEDYELLDCGGGEKLERWGQVDPRASRPAGHLGDAAREPRLEERAGHATTARPPAADIGTRKSCPSSWQMRYRDLTFQCKPMNFKHTGLFPEQAVNWDFARGEDRAARAVPSSVLNLFAYTGAAQRRLRDERARASAMWTPPRAWSPGRGRTQRSPVWPTRRSAGSWTTARSSSSARSAAARPVRRHHHGPAVLRPRPGRRGLEAGG